MSRWPDEVVLSFPRPQRMFPSNADWLRMVIDADWLFRHGWDSVDIGEAMGVHEAVVCRALAQARSARREPDGGASNATSQFQSTQVNEGGGGVS